MSFGRFAPSQGRPPSCPTSELRFYSTDKAGNSEAVATARYLFNTKIEVWPKPTDFGAVAEGATGVRYPTIYNTGTAPLVVTSPMTITGPDSAFFTVVPGGPRPCDSLAPTLAPGQSCTVAVSFLPTQGAKSATLRILSNSLISPQLEVPLLGTGIRFVSLTTNISGIGSVNIDSFPSYGCTSSSCTFLYQAGTTVNLMGTPSWVYSFEGWSGGGCSGTGSCRLTLDTDTVVNATFMPLPLVQNSYSLMTFLALQQAYVAAADGHKLKVRNLPLVGNFELNSNIKVSLEGGMASDFATASGNTVMFGVLKVRAGRLNVKNLIVRWSTAWGFGVRRSRIRGWLLLGVINLDG